MTLDEWGAKWGVPSAALQDFRAVFGVAGEQATRHPKRENEGASEGHVQSAVRLEAAYNKDLILFRNNVGALLDERGVPVRYGLANESKAQNKIIKSSDLIGIRRVMIGPWHVGRTLGQFVAREVKHGTWQWGEDLSREVPQKAFLDLVLSYGGDAAFAAGVGTL